MSGPDANYSRPAMEIISKIEALTLKVRAANELREAFVEERSQKVADIIARIKDLKINNAKNGVDIEALRQNLAGKEEELKSLTEEVSKGVSGGKELNDKIEELTNQIKLRDDELIVLKKQLAESIAKEENLKTEVNALEETVNKFKSEVARLENELEDSREENQLLTGKKEAELTEAKRQLEDANGQLEVAKKQLDDAMRQLEDAKASNEVEKNRLANEMSDLRVKLQNSEEMKLHALEHSKDLDEAIRDITNSLRDTYDNLKIEIEKLLNLSETDKTEQRELLRSILGALDGEQRVLAENAFKNVARDKFPGDPSKSVASDLSKSANNFITPFNERMAKYFDFDESTQNYTIKDKITNVGFLSPLSIDAVELGKIKGIDPLFEKKLNAYKAFKGRITIIPEARVIGGRRKRTTQKKRPRNKKVTRRLAKRRRTQKKRRPIRKRRTARK